MTAIKFIIVAFLFCLFQINSSYAKVDTSLFSKEQREPQMLPSPDCVWVFIMAGQSNMAGRGKIESQDTISNNRILSVNKKNEIVVAKEPLHFYEPTRAGLDCGMSFGKFLLRHVPDSVSILLVPTAVGDSRIDQWLRDTNHRGVNLLSNFKEKVKLAMEYGEVKAILWHQGESDAKPKGIEKRQEKLTELFAKFRNITGNSETPIIIGELGSYSKNPEYWHQMNIEAERYTKKDQFSIIVSTSKFKDRGDKMHFTSKGQRKLGKRYAKAYLKKFADK